MYSPFTLTLLAAALAAPPAMALQTGVPHPGLWFEANVGQAQTPVQFLARGAGATLFLLRGGEAHLRTPQAGLRMRLAGAASPAGRAIDPLPGRIHYLTGSDPKRWRTDVPTYSTIRFDSVYPGIDIVYHGSDRLEYDFIVAPEADPGIIMLEFTGTVLSSLRAISSSATVPNERGDGIG
jgi:hypothetical protein